MYDLGERSFLIGRSGCHLELPRASIPDRAIRIRAAEDGLSFEGIGGFGVPLATVSIQAGQIKPGSGLTLGLEPPELGSPDPPAAAANEEGESATTEPTPDPPAPTAAEAPTVAEAPRKPAPRTPDATVELLYQNKMRHAWMTVWIDGKRVLSEEITGTKITGPKSVFKRIVGQQVRTKIPVVSGKRSIEVRITEPPEEVDAVDRIQGALEPGQTRRLKVTLKRRSNQLRLEWEE